MLLAACGSDDDPQGFDGGLLGTLSCDDFGDCGTGEVSIFQHTDPGITDPAGLEPVYPQTGRSPADKAPASLDLKKGKVQAVSQIRPQLRL